MARKKSDFYKTRSRVGVNETKAAEIIGVSVDDIQQFDIEGAPIAERLLLLWDSKHVGHEGWNGFIFSRGVLRYKNRRWSPQSIKLWFDQDEEIVKLQREIKRLKTWRGLFTVSVHKAVDCIRQNKAGKGFKVD